MTKEEFINSKIKLSKEDIIEDYYKTEEKLIKNIGIEHKNYELQQENEHLREAINKAIEYINAHLKQDMLSDFTGATYMREYISEPDELLDILKEVSNE